MTFSLVFLLKMGILHFYDYLRNKGGYPTLYFAIFAIYMGRQVTYMKNRES